MNRKKLEKIIREEIVNERADGRLAQIIAGTVDKLIGAWRGTKQGVSDYILDQASQELRRGVLSSFALINKKVDRGQYSDISQQKTTGTGQFAGGSLEEEEKKYTVNTTWGVLESTDFEAALRTAKIWMKGGVLNPEGTSPEIMQALSGEGESESLREMIARILHQAVNEVAPPGREKQVKGLKKHIGKDIPKTYTDSSGKRKKSNPYALAWSQQKKHGKPSKEKK